MSALRMSASLAITADTQISHHAVGNMTSINAIESSVWLTLRNTLRDETQRWKMLGSQEIDIWFYDITALQNFVEHAQQLLIAVHKEVMVNQKNAAKSVETNDTAEESA